MRISDWSSDVCSSDLFEYSDRQCARRKGDDDERPEIDRLAMQETLQADRQGKQDGAAQPGQGIQPGKMDGRESPCFHHRETRSWLLGSSPLIAASFSARCSSGGLIAALVDRKSTRLNSSH